MSDSQIPSANLSEILFKPKHDYIETSLISNSGCPIPDVGDGLHFMGSPFRALWYRPLNLYTWSYLGANNLDIERALSQIVMSNNERSRETCFDTVSQYGAGNWIYEFSSIAQERVMKGCEAQEKGDMHNASHQYRMASRYFAIASYPNLRGDVLAAQASLLGRQAYRKIFNDEKEFGFYAEHTFLVRNVKVTGHLHSIDNHTLQPCVVVVSAYGDTSTDYYRLFSDYLRKLGIAIFVIDMPGMGDASKISLDANTSDVLEAAVDYLRDKVNFIDNTALGAMGYRFSTNPVARLALLRPDLFKAIALASPALHSAFVNHKLLNNMPLAARSSLANRMGLDASNWDTIVPQLQMLSLKKQGLIGYHASNKVPVLSVFTPVDLKFNDDDLSVIDNAFVNHIVVKHKHIRVSEFAPMVFSDIASFFKEKLIG